MFIWFLKLLEGNRVDTSIQPLGGRGRERCSRTVNGGPWAGQPQKELWAMAPGEVSERLGPHPQHGPSDLLAGQAVQIQGAGHVQGRGRFHGVALVPTAWLPSFHWAEGQGYVDLVDGGLFVRSGQHPMKSREITGETMHPETVSPPGPGCSTCLSLTWPRA